MRCAEFNNVTDLNTIHLTLSAGIYYVLFISCNAANLPADISSSDRFVLEIGHFGFDTFQRVTARSSNITYQRYGSGNTTKTWTNWAKLQ